MYRAIQPPSRALQGVLNSWSSTIRHLSTRTSWAGAVHASTPAAIFPDLMTVQDATLPGFPSTPDSFLTSTMTLDPGRWVIVAIIDTWFYFRDIYTGIVGQFLETPQARLGEERNEATLGPLESIDGYLQLPVEVVLDQVTVVNQYAFAGWTGSGIDLPPNGVISAGTMIAFPG